MKKALILSILMIIGLTGNALAQKSLTARQLFMMLPNEYVSGTKTERLGALVFPKSVKADFLTFMLSGKQVPANLAGDFKQPEGLGDMRVFRGKSELLVGLRYQLGDATVATPTVDNTKVITVLLEYKGGKWTDVTATKLPTVATAEVHRTLIGFPDTKNAKPEDVWVETQVSKDRNGLMLVGRAKGSEAVTPLKFFKWDGSGFVESK